MVDMTYDGSYPVERLKAPRGCTPFNQYTIRNWTPHNCRIAAKRRCHFALMHLPSLEGFDDFGRLVNLGIPSEIEDIELDLYAAIDANATGQPMPVLDKKYPDILGEDQDT